MTAALFAINAGLEKARRQRKGASTLSLLQVVATREGIRPSEIAEVQHVHPSLVTRQVRDLEDAGYVEVTADPADRRSCLVKLLPAGTEELHRLDQFGVKRFELYVKDWKPEDVQQFTHLLEKLRTSMSTLSEGEPERSPGSRWRQRTPSQPNP
jgi:DNA-binding MarR family transcriptional regulator